MFNSPYSTPQELGIFVEEYVDYGRFTLCQSAWKLHNWEFPLVVKLTVALPCTGVQTTVTKYKCPAAVKHFKS